MLPLFLFYYLLKHNYPRLVFVQAYSKTRAFLHKQHRIGTSHIFKLEKQELNLHLIRDIMFCQLNYFPMFSFMLRLHINIEALSKHYGFFSYPLYAASRTYSKLQQPPCLRVAFLFSRITTLLSSFHRRRRATKFR